MQIKLGILSILLLMCPNFTFLSENHLYSVSFLQLHSILPHHLCITELFLLHTFGCEMQTDLTAQDTQTGRDALLKMA